jgi:hypothetical protein
MKSIRPSQIVGGEDKENDGIEDDDEPKKTKKKSNVSVCPRTVFLCVLMITFRSHESQRYFKENIDRNANIQLLQERWSCGKRGCGTYCFVNAKGEHVPLSHARMEVWAMVMVSPSFSCIVPR